ncbi:TrmH family RNA methyltransferase [Litorimonas sp. RW-G-Af-16]|uniref:TrmH family RNA methyltransferase n=1 Tax=Litorimonas sp. RW-G-Af-16 TaxID=3241168 RepID=UPI00390C5FCC
MARSDKGSDKSQGPSNSAGKGGSRGGNKSLRSAGYKGARSDNPKRAYGTKQHGAVSAPQSPRSPKDRSAKGSSRRSGSGNEGGSGWIYGTHASLAVLTNPKRTIHEVRLTDAASARLDLPHISAPVRDMVPAAMDKMFPRGTVHQGIAVKAAPLEWPDLETLADRADDNGLILVLDQITDPHNVGAMLRLCSAFGVSALVMQTRKAPPLSGSLAKVAVGCLETVPVCLETNIANTIQNLQRIGWHVTGLAGETDLSLSKALSMGGKRVIVMGAEGPGLRELVRKRCDQLARIPMMSSDVAGEAESLNVATAAAIALYEARRD